MATTKNQESILWRLRQLAPRRPLTQFEAYRVAELQANRLLSWGGIDQPGTPNELVTSLPFVQVVLRSDHPESGLTEWRKPRWRIELNSTEPAQRRRFSLMHEFKHIIDHEYAFITPHGRRLIRLYPDTEWQATEERMELVASYFAACVLMPKRLVKLRFFQGMQHSADLAGEFGVSQEAMYRRLQQLRLIEPIPHPDTPEFAPGTGTTYRRRAWMPKDVTPALGAVV